MKICGISLIFIYTIYFIYYKMQIENKYKKKFQQLRTHCITVINRILISILEFINKLTRFLHFYFCFVNL